MSESTVGVKLDQQTRDRLRQLGYAKDRSTHWLMKEAVARYLDVEERYEREKAEDEARWLRYVDTGEAVPHTEVQTRIDQMISAADKRRRS